MRPNTTAATAAALARFHNWLRRAAPGDSYTYHVGLLSADRCEATYDPTTADLTFLPVEPFNSVGHAALEAATAGLVSLVQRREGPAHYSYIARRTKQNA